MNQRLFSLVMTLMDSLQIDQRRKSALFKRSLFYWSLFLYLTLTILGNAAEGAKGEVRGEVAVNGTLAANAVVYILPTDGKTLTPSPMEKTISQEEKKFIPSFTVVTVGSTIHFENRSGMIHNISSRSGPNRFDLGTHLPNSIKKVVLKKAGIVTLRCKVHPEMRGRIYVSPSPFFAVTDRAGTFEIDGLPPGPYQIHTWHPSLTPKEASKGRQNVVIGSEASKVHLEFFGQSDPEKDLTDVINRNWFDLIDSIQSALDKAFSRWQRKKQTAAAIRVMTAQSKLFHQSGLRDAIAESQGKPRAIEHELRFDKIRKWMQSIGDVPVEASVLREEIDRLIQDLKEDATVIQQL